MNRYTQLVNARYEALMFAKSAGEAQKAARELARLVLGEESSDRPLDEVLRACCRKLRPSEDPREQARYEEEFLELGIWQTPAAQPAAQVNGSRRAHESRKIAA